LGGSTSESSVMRRTAPASSSSTDGSGSTLSTGRGGSAEAGADCCSSCATVSAGSERSPRASVAKRGSTSTSSGLTISGWAGLSMFPVATIRDLYPSNEGRYVTKARRLRGLATVASAHLATSVFVTRRPRRPRVSGVRKRMRLVEQVPGYVIRGWEDCGLERMNVMRTRAVLRWFSPSSPRSGGVATLSFAGRSSVTRLSRFQTTSSRISGSLRSLRRISTQSREWASSKSALGPTRGAGSDFAVSAAACLPPNVATFAWRPLGTACPRVPRSPAARGHRSRARSHRRG